MGVGSLKNVSGSNDNTKIEKLKMLEDIEKECNEPSPAEELMAYLEYGDKGKEILEKENEAEAELENKILTR